MGHLCFDDFLLLRKWGLSRESASFEGLSPFSPELTSGWALALNNAPHVLRHMEATGCRLPIVSARPCPSMSSIASAQTRLVAHFALDLLRAKAPPLYDALPWHDWDFSIVTKRFPLWKTRFLLAGDGTTVAICRCRKSAGVYALEPDETIARYIERKAALEKVRRVRVLHSSLSPSLPLPSSSVDLAVVGSSPALETGHWKLVTQELLRISSNILLVENSPLCPPLDDKALADVQFRPASVEVRGLGQRRCWWLSSDGT